MKNTRPPEKQIDITTEYEIFGHIVGNRPLDEAHVVKLMQKISENDLFTPIHVDQDFNVIDGQHRLEARRRLGLPVPYFWVSGQGLDEVQQLNANQKKWTNDDYANSWIARGNKHYEVYEWFRKRYGFPHDASVKILIGKEPNNLRMIFISGEMKIADLNKSKQLAEKLLELEPHFSHAKDAKFVSAMLNIMQREGFVFKTFMHRLATNPTMLKPCTSKDLYLQAIEDLYNYRANTKIPLRYAPVAQKYRTAML